MNFDLMTIITFIFAFLLGWIIRTMLYTTIGKFHVYYDEEGRCLAKIEFYTDNLSDIIKHKRALMDIEYTQDNRSL